MMASIERRFWSKVSVTSTCWYWTGSLTGAKNFKYGQIGWQGSKKVLAHRAAWLLEYGVDSIPDDLLVLHKCDNPVCVRASHLFLGTDKDNRDDMCRKGRQPKPVCKYSDDFLQLLRNQVLSGISYCELGRRHGIDRSYISDLMRGRIRQLPFEPLLPKRCGMKDWSPIE